MGDNAIISQKCNIISNKMEKFQIYCQYEDLLDEKLSRGIKVIESSLFDEFWIVTLIGK